VIRKERLGGLLNLLRTARSEREARRGLTQGFARKAKQRRTLLIARRAGLQARDQAARGLRARDQAASVLGGYRYLLRDRDSIYSRQLDRAIEHLGLKTVRSPPRSPKANAICERVIGTIRRECLDWVIPVSEVHLRLILREWVTHYNRARPHSALGPGIPDPPATMGQLQHGCVTRQRLPEMRVRAVLGGLHHEYSWATESL